MTGEWVSIYGQWRLVCRVCGAARRSVTVTAQDARVVRESFERQARALGWRLFVGRDRYWYCAAHSPATGHKMREVAA